MNKLSKIYMKYIVKSFTAYIIFILLGIFFFIYVSLNVKVEVIETFEGIYAEERLVINETVNYPIEKIYAYQSRNEEIITYNVKDIDIIDESYTVLFLGESDDIGKLEGVIRIDVVKKHVSIFSVIFCGEKRYVEKGLK